MGIKATLVDVIARSGIGKELENRIVKRIKESNNDPRVKREAEDRNWRQITARNVKDLNPLEQWKMQKIAYWLYDKNPIGHRIVERYKDFVIGDGLTYFINDKDVKEVIDEHWNDSDNLWDMKQSEKIKELGLYGEQFYPVFINEHTGKVKLGYIDPELVDKVDTDPENAEKRISYNLKMDSSIDKSTKVKYTIINADKETDLLEGESFFFLINTVANKPRGRADLFPISDGIDAYENFLFNCAERADLATRLIYDLLLQGKSAEEIEEILKEFEIPRANEVFGHNEKTTLSLTMPKLESSDITSAATLFLNHILAGAGFPPHWFAGGQELTRATAVAMDLPTKKQLRSRQKYFKWMVGYIFRFQIHQSIKYGRLDKSKKDVPIEIQLPKIEEKEIETVANAMVNITNSLSLAVEEGWISVENAKLVYRNIVSLLGVGLEMTTEQEEKLEKEERQIDETLKQIYMKKKQADLYKAEVGDAD